jgi:hypothetical protein
MTDNIKMPPLPPWMERYEIPDDDFEGGRANLDSRMRSYAREAVRLNATVPDALEKELSQAIKERDAADAYIDALLDEVLGTDRPEWSSVYGHADAMEQVRERVNTLMKPSIDKAWDRFQSAVAPAAPQPAQQERKRRYAQGTALGEFGIIPMCDQVDDEPVKVSSDAISVVGVPEFDALMDHIYENGTASEGVLPLANAFARAIEQAATAPLLARIEELEDKFAEGAQAVRWAPSSAYWYNELRLIFGPEAREGIDALEARLREAQDVAESKLAEKDILLRQALDALEDYAKQYPHMQKGYMLDAAEAIRNHLGVKND